MQKKYEIRIKSQLTNDGTGAFFKEEYSWPTCDNYLSTLMDFLFECRFRIPRTIEILESDKDGGLGGDSVYFDVEGPTAIIYDYYATEGCPENGIKINRKDLIQILEAWLETNEYNRMDEIILQRDQQHITLIVKFDDQTEFRKSFNYRWQDEPYPHIS